MGGGQACRLYLSIQQLCCWTCNSESYFSTSQCITIINPKRWQTRGWVNMRSTSIFTTPPSWIPPRRVLFSRSPDLTRSKHTTRVIPSPARASSFEWRSLFLSHHDFLRPACLRQTADSPIPLFSIELLMLFHDSSSSNLFWLWFIHWFPFDLGWSSWLYGLGLQRMLSVCESLRHDSNILCRLSGVEVGLDWPAKAPLNWRV